MSFHLDCVSKRLISVEEVAQAAATRTPVEVPVSAFLKLDDQARIPIDSVVTIRIDGVTYDDGSKNPSMYARAISVGSELAAKIPTPCTDWYCDIEITPTGTEIHFWERMKILVEEKSQEATTAGMRALLKKVQSPIIIRTCNSFTDFGLSPEMMGIKPLSIDLSVGKESLRIWKTEKNVQDDTWSYKYRLRK